MTSILLISALYASAVPYNLTTAKHEIRAVSNSSSTGLSCSNTRSLESLLWSCLSIIFSCTWIIIHPNVPGPKETTSSLFLRKIKIFLVALIAPEWMVVWAFRQYLSARRYTTLYNEIHGKSSEWLHNNFIFYLLSNFPWQVDGH